LGDLYHSHANVVDLQAHTSFDEVCVLAHKVEQQKKVKQPPKHESPKPPPYDQSVNKGSPLLPLNPPIPPIPQKNQTLQQSLPHNLDLQPFLRVPKDVLSGKDLGTYL